MTQMVITMIFGSVLLAVGVIYFLIRTWLVQRARNVTERVSPGGSQTGFFSFQKSAGDAIAAMFAFIGAVLVVVGLFGGSMEGLFG